MPVPKGKRYGGKPKGYKAPATLDKLQVREMVRQRLSAQADVFVDALVSRAGGVRYFVTRDKKSGKFEIVTNPEQVVKALNGEDGFTGEFYTDKPDVSAIREAFDRMIDRPKEQEITVEVRHTRDLSDAELLAEAAAITERSKGKDAAVVH